MNTELKKASDLFVRAATLPVGDPPSPDDLVKLIRELALGMQQVTLALDYMQYEARKSRQ